MFLLSFGFSNMLFKCEWKVLKVLYAMCYFKIILKYYAMYHRPLFYSSLIENFCLQSYSPGLVHALKSYYVCVMSAENCLFFLLEGRERFPYLCLEHSLPKHTAFFSMHSSANKILIFSYQLTSNKMLVFCNLYIFVSFVYPTWSC